jgi:hypothetical protein
MPTPSEFPRPSALVGLGEHSRRRPRKAWSPGNRLWQGQKIDVADGQMELARSELSAP